MTLANKSMKRRPRVIDHTIDEFMLSWVPMNVVRTAMKIVFISNSMFPEPWLPNSMLILFAFGVSNFHFGMSSF